MVCAETSKRRARSSTITRPKARARLRISFWRWVRPVITAPRTEYASWCGGSGIRSTRQIGFKGASGAEHRARVKGNPRPNRRHCEKQSDEAIQSSFPFREGMDCFAHPVIGRAFATRWLAMMGIHSQMQHHARSFTGRSGCSTKQSVAAKLPPNKKNGGSDEYRSSSADLAG